MQDHRCRRRAPARAVGRAILIALLPVLAITGCGKSTKQYAQFAQAGTTYAAAMDGLLVATRNVEVSTNSEILLNLATISPVTGTEYDKIRDPEKRTDATIQRLRKHTQLMGDYFTQLYAVATSDAPDRASTAAGGLATSLNGLGKELRGTGTLLTQPQVDAIGTVSKLVVTAKIRETLKRTLERDNQTIRQELQTQQELLAALSRRIENDLNDQNNQQEQRLVKDPLAHPTEKLNDRGKQDAFVADRQRLANAQTTTQELTTASDAARKLKAAYEDLLSGTLNTAAVNNLLDDLDALLAFAKSVRTVSGGE